MNYRPENWEEIKFQICMDLTEGGGSYKDIYEVFEAGADAEYEAIMATLDNQTRALVYRILQGELVIVDFIPEESDE